VHKINIVAGAASRGWGRVVKLPRAAVFGFVEIFSRHYASYKTIGNKNLSSKVFDYNNYIYLTGYKANKFV